MLGFTLQDIRVTFGIFGVGGVACVLVGPSSSRGYESKVDGSACRRCYRRGNGITLIQLVGYQKKRWKRRRICSLLDLGDDEGVTVTTRFRESILLLIRRVETSC